MSTRTTIDEVGESRRRLLRQSVTVGLALVMDGLAWPLRALSWTPAPSMGSTVIDVCARGAVGDGVHDDTAAIQSAIDALPVGGGTVRVPVGRYLVDTANPLRLRNRMRLELAPDAVLMARPSNRKRFYVMLLDGISDVEVAGGRIVGDRDRHLGSEGEWGYGIFVRGSSRVLIRDINISKCWGDGICVGAATGAVTAPKYSSDVTLSKVVCTGNRRQGLTIGPVRGIRVIDSEFSDTHGTKPACGIDIEPDKPAIAQNIRIENCIMRGNQGCGIQIYHNVSQVSLRHCTIRNNSGYGVLLVGATQGLIDQNTITGNGLAGAVLRGNATDCQVRDNRFENNATKKVRHLLDNLRQASATSLTTDTSDIQVMDDTRSITISGNTFLP